MRRRPRPVPLAERPEVKRHLHTDWEVTPERLHAFSIAPERDRLFVSAELRRRAEDQELTLLPALEASALAIIAIFLAVTPNEMKFAVVAHVATTGLDRWLTVTLGYVIYGVVAGAVLLPSIWGAVKRNRDRCRAAVWLAAYERYEDRPKRKSFPWLRGRE